MTQCFQKQAVIDVVEQATDVVLQHPITLPASLARHRERIMRRLPAPVTVRVVMEDGLQDRFQHERDDRLRDPVADRRHAEYPLPAGLLRNRYRLDRRGEVAPRRHPVPDPVEVPALIAIKLLDRLAINTGRAPIGLHALVCLPYQSFRNDKRFCRFHRLILPGELAGGSTGTTRPLRLRVHYRHLCATTGRSVLGPRFSTLGLAFLHLTFSFRITAPSSRSSAKTPESSSRHLYAGHRPPGKQGIWWAHPGNSCGPRF